MARPEAFTDRVASSSASVGKDLVIEYKRELLQQLLEQYGPVEVLSRMYALPDYRRVIDIHLTRLVKRLEEDPEALEAFLSLLRDFGVDLQDDLRAVPLVVGAGYAVWVVGGAAVTGLAIGIWAAIVED